VPLLWNVLSCNPSIEHSTFVAPEKRIPHYLDSKNNVFLLIEVLMYISEFLYIVDGNLSVPPSEDPHDGGSSLHMGLYQLHNAKSSVLCQHPLKRKVIGIFNFQ
jgi:hypothetical protein